MSVNAGEISVDLRLQLTKLQGDVNRAAGMMRKGLAVNLTGGGGGGGRGRGGSGSGSGGSSGSGPPPVGGGSAGSGGGGGIPPIIPSGSGGGGTGGARGFGGFRFYGGGHASLGRAVLGGLVGGVAAGGILQAFKMLEEVINKLIKVFEDASKLYVNAVRTGGGAGFATNKAVLAEVMGVSQDEVFRFGAAMQYAARMTGAATDALVRTMPALTATTWHFRATLISLKAAFSTLAMSLAPFITFLLDAARKIADFISSHQWIADALALGVGLGSPRTTKGSGIEVPAPVAAPDRLPASAWEKMGLIVGNSANTNYAQKTAENTRRLVQLWEQFVGGQAIQDMPQGGFQGGPGISRSGTPILSPVTNSP